MTKALCLGEGRCRRTRAWSRVPIFDTASYIVVARDGPDAFISYANHMAHMRADLRGRLNAQAAAQEIDPLMEFHGDIHEFFDRWIAAAPTMLFRGTNGRWQNVLSDGELQRYRQRVDELLPPAAAHWLEHGGRR
jgi:hypothetical protein